MHQNVSTLLKEMVERCTGMARGQFPITYLRCPITHVKKRKSDYNDLIKKVRDKLQAWKVKMISYGGKAVCGLQSIPIHIQSAIVPPKCVIKEFIIVRQTMVILAPIVHLNQEMTKFILLEIFGSR